MGVLVSPSTAELPPSTAEQPPFTAEQPPTSNFHFNSPTTPQTPSLLSSPSTPHPPPPTFSIRCDHALTGYVAALIDFSRRGGSASLDAVACDVHRLASVVAEVLEESSMDDRGKVEAVRDALEGGGFDCRLAALVRMVAAKAKGPDAIAELLKEFWRVWGEMAAAAEDEMEVVVATERKMRVEELARIAREMHRARGVLQVKVKHLFGSES